MKPFIEPTKGRSPPTWADIDWRAVEMNVGRLQERIYRATKDEDWKKVKSLQKLLARATSTTGPPLVPSTASPTDGLQGTKT